MEQSSMFARFMEELKELIRSVIEKAIKESQSNKPEWLSLKEGASHAGVSYNTFIKFREMGLKVCEIDGIKRVSKTEIDRFMNSNSF